MKTETMSVHQALIARKILEKKIDKAIASINFVGSKKAIDTKVNGVDVKDYEEMAKSEYQSLMDLVRRYTAIKNAIVVSNATTMVTVMGVNYTVAEVIELLRSGVHFMDQFVENASFNYKRAISAVEANNVQLEAKADNYVSSLPAGKDVKNLSEEMKKMRTDYIQQFTCGLVDPLGIADIIDKVTQFRDTFKIEADAALSVSNATTSITITYDD